MRGKSKPIKSVVVISTLVLCLTLLSACFSIKQVFAPDGAATVTDGFSEPTDAQKKAFFDGVAAVLLKTVQHSNTISQAMATDYLNLQTDDTTAGYTAETIRLTSPQNASSDVTMTTESIRNSETGDAALLTVNQKGGTTHRSNLFFISNMMYLQKDGGQPMIRHMLDTQVAASFRELPAMTRFLRILDDTNAPKMTDDAWKADINGYCSAVDDISNGPDIITSSENNTFAGVNVTCAAKTLTLRGENALSAARSLLSLLGQDASLKASFNTYLMTDGGQYGVTGFDGMIRDIDALKTDGRNSAVLTIKLVTTDGPTGLHLLLKVGEKTFSLDLSFYEKDGVRADSVLFAGFDGSRVFMKAENAQANGGQTQGSLIYDVLSPGGKPQENLTVTTLGSAQDMTAQISYVHVATADIGEKNIKGQMRTQRTENGDTTQMISNGSFQVRDEHGSRTVILDKTRTQTDKAPPITAPAFTVGSDISTSGQAGLDKALGDFDGPSYALAPPTTRWQAVYMLLMN
ncbi:hypothetical protein IZU99_02770 [Oscillospiraceae bacterium CM]|nr:hypothetical protein IZU99_02770 [Oscillospiraceae bacterium CM]